MSEQVLERNDNVLPLMSVGRIAYWNCLADDQHAPKMDYIEALQEVHNPDVIILTECRVELADRLTEAFGDQVDYAVTREGYPHIASSMYGKQGMCIISKSPVEDLQREALRAPVIYKWVHDNREFMEFKVRNRQVGKLAVHATHISHPHHVLTSPKYNKSRSLEWQHCVQQIEDEHLPFAWFADTNTILSSTVRRRLQLDRLGAKLLPHGGGPTWGPGDGRNRRRLYLDRCAVSSSIAPFSTLETIGNIGGMVTPSDHQPIMLIIQ